MCTNKGEKRERTEDAIDRISNLPDCVIHHILSFVPTVDAVRSSLVSRRWRRMWHCVPVLQFPDRVGFENQNLFDEFVERCLKHRRRAMRFLDDSAVKTFELSAEYSPVLQDGLSKWLGSKVVMNNVVRLDLRLLSESRYRDPVCLPPAMMNGKSLTHLNLEGCLEIGPFPVDLPSLVSLSLLNVQLDEDIFDNIFAGSPSLEKCVVLENSCVFHLEISSTSLRYLDIEAEILSANIKASNLEFLRLMDICGPELDISNCNTIRVIMISDISNLDIKKFEDQVSKLPLLHTLTLYLSKIEQLNISSNSLKHVSLHKSEKQEIAVTTDTPNLVSFDYTGDIDLKMSTELLYQGVEGRFVVSGSSSELLDFLSNINPVWNNFSVRCFVEDEGIILNKNLREISSSPGPFNYTLTVNFSCKCTQKSDFTQFVERLSAF